MFVFFFENHLLKKRSKCSIFFNTKKRLFFICSVLCFFVPL